MDEQNKYFEKHVAACYRTDCHSLMRADAFLDLAQQIAGKGAEHFNFGRDKMLEFGCAWVLGRMRVVFEKPVGFDEEFTLSTWHKGASGLYMIRDYRLETAAGAAINATSSWIVMDLATRSLSRDQRLYESIPYETQCHDDAIVENAPRLKLPAGSGPTLIGEHRVRYSDIDTNGHVNNVKYTTWAIDALPEDLVFNRSLRELSINFNKEMRRGDTVSLYHVESDGAHYVEGRSEGRQVFIEKLIFGDAPAAE